MKQLVYTFLLSIVLLPLASSCTSEAEKSEWRITNEEVYYDIVLSNEWKEVDFEGVERGIFYRDIPREPGEEVEKGTEYPEFTSTVDVLYSVKFYDNEDIDLGTTYSNVPLTFDLADIYENGVRGFSIVLQDMVVGDKREVCIPWWLGYGSTEADGIPAFTTLFFTIELMSINQTPWR